MAWPLDANDVVYSGEQIVPDTNLNEIQERIVDIHRERSQTFWPTVCEMPLSVPSWAPQGGTTPEWGCITGGETLWIPVSLPPGSVIKQVVVKVYLAAATGLFVRLDKVQANFASGTTAPAFTNVEAPASPTGHGGVERCGHADAKPHRCIRGNLFGPRRRPRRGRYVRRRAGCL